MASNVPVVNQVSKGAFLIQVIFILVVLFVSGNLWHPHGAMVGGLACIGYMLWARHGIAKHHRAGINCVKAEEYEKAIPHFQESTRFFENNNWIDKYRIIVLMSVSSLSYHEMSITNLAFCYSQTGDGQNARSQYERCLSLYPENGIAKAALRMLDV